MKHVGDSLQAFVSGELSVEKRDAVEAHLVTCDQCRREEAEVRGLWNLLGEAEVDPPVDRSIWDTVRSRTLEKKEGSRDWLFGREPWTRAGLAAAAVAAGLVCGILVPGGENTGSNESSGEDAAWLVESTWLSNSSWLSGDGSQGLDDIILGADPVELENGS